MIITIALIAFAALVVVYAVSIWLDAATDRSPFDD